MCENRWSSVSGDAIYFLPHSCFLSLYSMPQLDPANTYWDSTLCLSPSFSNISLPPYQNLDLKASCSSHSHSLQCRKIVLQSQFTLLNVSIQSKKYVESYIALFLHDYNFVRSSFNYYRRRLNYLKSWPDNVIPHPIRKLYTHYSAI